MSLFEKIVVPFLVPELNNLYFTDVVGFKDCYTHDLDNPSTDKEFFIMFDNRKQATNTAIFNTIL